ncbi:DUF3027 domain-containing protein [Paenarthrobacter aurescens]|uniref:DUF3027 domain-containing protein n=1 Tax=Paenarthrobacter aurescens TaxID=43663 RepID=A0A4Y3NHU3_PAEAU|nr:DUF3027 domain-containing protein [Paenarthrobacter aurescens]MDO6142597.1 DUF3027 domain-containing protein [Paenarthrobacter aurescens]MDO6146444.1 DUF3027 domain-containing protein [Paenarthrobacter aurescens]MDO6157689.1 DUF3027 domain-containing protein [Paenarthrobacter aurescens]MDO6161674.1 DUF3027 domain-containing protein [Paenarthrobacter aurescens]GEB20783.1 hypothetical protein AAU01_35380 [Paenarthrobacter aurescens]
MTSESAQDTKAAPEAAQAPGNGDAPARKTGAAKPRTGLPVWRTGKPDAFLAAAVDTARAAVEGIANPGEVGAHLGAKSEGDRVVTHLFESRLAGYGGWQWYAVVTRNSRSKIVTVSELGLLPSEDSILAPEWVPWAKRVRPEDETPLVEESVEDVSEESVQAAEDEATDSAVDAGDAEDLDETDDSEADESGAE